MAHVHALRCINQRPQLQKAQPCSGSAQPCRQPGLLLGIAPLQKLELHQKEGMRPFAADTAFQPTPLRLALAASTTRSRCTLQLRVLHAPAACLTNLAACSPPAL